MCPEGICGNETETSLFIGRLREKKQGVVSMMEVKGKGGSEGPLEFHIVDEIRALVGRGSIRGGSEKAVLTYFLKVLPELCKNLGWYLGLPKSRCRMVD